MVSFSHNQVAGTPVPPATRLPRSGPQPQEALDGHVPLGRRSEDEAHHSPPSAGMEAHPESFFNVHPGIVEETA